MSSRDPGSVHPTPPLRTLAGSGLLAFALWACNPSAFDGLSGKAARPDAEQVVCTMMGGEGCGCALGECVGNCVAP